MAGPIELVKAHPVIAGVGIIAVIGTTLLLTSGGSGAEVVTVAPRGPVSGGGDDSAAIQMQAMQGQISNQRAEIEAKLQLGMAETSAQQYIASLQFQSTDTANQLAAGVANAGISAEERVKSLTSTLAADIESKRIAADSAESAMQYATIQQQTKAQVDQAKYFADATIATTNAQLTAQREASATAASIAATQAAYAAETERQRIAAENERARIAANAQIEASKPKGFFSFLFG